MQCRKGLYAMQALSSFERRKAVNSVDIWRRASWPIGAKCYEVGRCLLCVKASTGDVAAVESSLMKVCIQREAKVHLHWPWGCFPGVGDIEILF